MFFTKWALRPDSGGPGRHRGGLGAIYEIELLEENADVFLFGERGRHAPPGVVGGSPGALNQFTYEQDDGHHAPPMASKMVGIKITKGQHLHLETPGGGGFGAAHERDPLAVSRDVQMGFVSVEAAARDYGVVLDEHGVVDETATTKRRA